METSKRPLVATAIRTEFGEVLEDADFYESAQRDLTYVPGYSDLRRSRDALLGKISQGKVPKGTKVPTLPVRLQWVRTAKASGAPDSYKQVQYGTDGYREVTEADVGQAWLTEMPAGAKVGVGGAIHQGDCVLMVCDAQRAARNAAIVRRHTERLTKDAPAANLMKLGEQTRGADPTFTSEPGREIKAPPSNIKS